ncbi:hypothetical protein F4818DRAFT_429225 [Hypoxylon cercidicola]|nr:hypothetical protein F4818DRAFT_429225 [Hypoxylon cercidicola]
MSSSQKSWECNVVGCGKKFTRKEHLNRHNLTHEPVHQHKCHVCGRRYARSDVFKRHLKQHNPQSPQPSDVRRICLPCGERNTQCDGNSPCGACISNWTECCWVGSDNSHGAGTAVSLVNGDTPTSTDETRGAGQAAGVLSNDHAQTWFPPNPQTWTPGYPATPPYSLVPGDLNTDHQAQNVVCSAGIVTEGSNISTIRVEPVQPGTTNNCIISPQPESPRTSLPQTTINPPESAAAVKIHAILNRCIPTTRRLVGQFFAEIHPYWAILHTPTFEISRTPSVLIASMVMLASWLENGDEHRELAPALYEELNQVRMDLHPPLHKLQAILFYIVYATCSLTEEGMVARALNLTGLLISTCRYLGIFNGQYTYNEMGGTAHEFPFVVWRIQEQLNRIAFASLRVDAYLSILLDHPPSIRYQELCIPLPKSCGLWAAASDDERRKLQWNEPAGREKALFSFFMRDALDPHRIGNLPYCLTDIDYHLSICAIQAPIWEAAREAHSSMSDELVDEADPTKPLKHTYAHLTLWRDKQKQDCDIREQYFSGASCGDKEHVLASLTITLMYMSTLKTYAPLNLLRVSGHYYKSRPGASMPTRRRRAHLRQWITSGCPRMALWNAAQICRVFSLESSRSSSSTQPRAHLQLNPLLIPGVMMSAVVACSYARHTQMCARCTPAAHTPSSPTAGMAAAAPMKAIDLFHTAPDDPALRRWSMCDDGVPYWGCNDGDRIPVCKCRLTAIAAWFREAFAQDEKAEMEFVLFLAELSREDS